jgi:hypothetical protein
MKRRHLLSVPVLALALVAGPGAVSPASAAAPDAPGGADREGGADKKEVYTGLIYVTSFERSPRDREDDRLTGAVRRFSFDLTAVVTGELSGRLTEHYDCRRVHDRITCQGSAKMVADNGDVSDIRIRLDCDPELVCTGKSHFTGVTLAEERIHGKSTITPVGPGVVRYVTTVHRR